MLISYIGVKDKFLDEDEKVQKNSERRLAC